MTKVFIDEFKGHQMFTVWLVDEDGEKVGKYPIVSFGLKKAVAISDHVEELKQFIDDMV